MDLVTLDFETYYDRDYSLSKMTTEAYVRDPRFEVIGVGVKVNDHATDWYSGADTGRFLHSRLYYATTLRLTGPYWAGGLVSNLSCGSTHYLWQDPSTR